MNEFEREPGQQHLPEGEKQVPDSEKSAETITKILAIIGLIALLALAAWVSVQVIRFAPSVFSSVASGVSSATVSVTSWFGGSDDTATDAPFVFANEEQQALAGATTSVAFSYENALAGQEYAFSFGCEPGVTLAVLTADDTFEELTCGEPYVFTSADQELVVRPTLLLADQERAEIDVTLEALGGDGEVVFADEMVLAIARDGALPEEDGADETPVADDAPGNDAAAPTPPSAQPAPSPAAPQQDVVYVPGSGTSDQNGRPDLALRVLATGMQIDVEGEKTFFEVDEVPEDENAAVKFEVINLGTKTSEEFTFAAELPIIGNDDYLFESRTQQALNPGERIEYVLAFDRANPDDDGATVSFTLLPEGDDEEAGNNFAEATIEIADE